MQSEECNPDQLQYGNVRRIRRCAVSNAQAKISPESILTGREKPISKREDRSIGLIFSRKMEAVYLVRKKDNAPTVVSISAIGGSKRQNETIHDAITRHASETAGYTGEFVYFGSLTTPFRGVHFFYSVIADGQTEPKTCSEDRIEKIPLHQLPKKFSIISPNLFWVIYSAIYHYLRANMDIAWGDTENFCLHF